MLKAWAHSMTSLRSWAETTNLVPRVLSLLRVERVPWEQGWGRNAKEDNIISALLKWSNVLWLAVQTERPEIPKEG